MGVVDSAVDVKKSTEVTSVLIRRYLEILQEHAVKIFLNRSEFMIILL